MKAEPLGGPQAARGADGPDQGSPCRGRTACQGGRSSRKLPTPAGRRDGARRARRGGGRGSGTPGAAGGHCRADAIPEQTCSVEVPERDPDAAASSAITTTNLALCPSATKLRSRVERAKPMSIVGRFTANYRLLASFTSTPNSSTSVGASSSSSAPGSYHADPEPGGDARDELRKAHQRGASRCRAVPEKERHRHRHHEECQHSVLRLRLEPRRPGCANSGAGQAAGQQAQNEGAHQPRVRSYLEPGTGRTAGDKKFVYI